MLIAINAATTPSDTRYAIGAEESIHAAEWIVWAETPELAHAFLTEHLMGNGTIGYDVYVQNTETEEGEWL